jgi:RNA recognition motif-containing protein
MSVTCAGYCFVTYRDKDCAYACIEALDDQDLFSSRRLRAELAKVSLLLVVLHA